MMKHINHKIIYASLVCLMTLSFSCCNDKLDITPKGKNTLGSVDDLEMLFNQQYDLGLPFTDLGLICNESYGQTVNVPTALSQKKTVLYSMITWDESVDRATLTLTDSRYTNAYKYINYMNTIIDKMPGASGDENKKMALEAEAHIMRAYIHWLLVNIYAPQYDEATAAKDGGIAYVTDLNVTDVKSKETVAQVYDNILADCSDKYINALPLHSNDVLRGDQAWGNAVRAKVLMQMKKYADAIPYATKSLELKPTIEDRSSVLTKLDWVLPKQAKSNLVFMGGPLFTETISPETISLFERGDYVKDYAFMNGQTSSESGGDDDDDDNSDARMQTCAKILKKSSTRADLQDGNPDDDYAPVNSANPSWSPLYGMMLSGVMGVDTYFSMNTYVNGYGITSDRMYYTLAECLIRTGKYTEGIDLINRVRKNRIHPSYYKDLSAANEADAMAILQKCKWIECISTYENFFDCKRWNTEPAYKRTITRHITDLNGNTYSFSIAPNSKLWIFPFPQDAVRKNSTLTQNY